MEHKEAIRIHAVDRYLLGELTAVERQEFEEHFFSCGECSEDLHTGAILVDNSRAVLREEFPDPVPASPGAPPRPGWRFWWSPCPAGRSRRIAGGGGLSESEGSSGIPAPACGRRGRRRAAPIHGSPGRARRRSSDSASQRHALLRNRGGRRRAGRRRVQLRDSGRSGGIPYSTSRADHSAGEKLNVLLNARR